MPLNQPADTVAELWRINRQALTNRNPKRCGDLPCHGEGSLEERLALVELRCQETHLPEKRVTFRRKKLKLGI
jgi:hypothetical protein